MYCWIVVLIMFFGFYWVNVPTNIKIEDIFASIKRNDDDESEEDQLKTETEVSEEEEEAEEEEGARQSCARILDFD
jgi:hypothetical protein